VYDLPSCSHVTSFGSVVAGPGSLHVDYPEAICFAPNGNLLVAEYINQRVQEITLSGEHVRFIGSDYCDQLTGLDANSEIIVVTQSQRYDQQIAVFAFDDGQLLCSFGTNAEGPAHVGACYAVALSPGGSHIVVAESEGHRLSVFTWTGVLVRRLGGEAGTIGIPSKLRWPHDVLWPRDDVILAVFSHGCTVAEFCPDDGRLLTQFGRFGLDAHDFREPIAMAVGGVTLNRGTLFVLEANVSKVHVMAM
jgi:DNA-binding beta-propeller fold protein YncE